MVSIVGFGLRGGCRGYSIKNISDRSLDFYLVGCGEEKSGD